MMPSGSVWGRACDDDGYVDIGAVPASVVPIIFFILVLGFIAWVLVAPFVNGYLEYIADQARAEIEERQKKKS